MVTYTDDDGRVYVLARLAKLECAAVPAHDVRDAEGRVIRALPSNELLCPVCGGPVDSVPVGLVRAYVDGREPRFVPTEKDPC